MKITLLTMGRNSDKRVEELVARYVGRLSHYVRFEVRDLPDVRLKGSVTTDRQKEAEGQSILATVAPRDFVMLLDERGKEYTSRGFAEMIERQMATQSRDIVFVVGGPFGFSKAVYDRADALISLSRMTLTHEMVRLFFVEQVYRAFTIIRGESYHHD